MPPITDVDTIAYLDMYDATTSATPSTTTNIRYDLHLAEFSAKATTLTCYGAVPNPLMCPSAGELG